MLYCYTRRLVGRIHREFSFDVERETKRKGLAFRAKTDDHFLNRAGLITQRSVNRNHFLLN